MKYTRYFTLLFCCFSVLFSAGAQDLKPVKDRETKKYGYQAKDKSWVIAPAFDEAKRFDEGLAEVEVNGGRGIINLNGEFVIAPEYDDISKFDKNGYCELKRKVGSARLQGVADRNGRIIIPVEARAVSVDRNGRYIYAKYDTEIPGFKSDQLWGVYDTDGKEIFPPRFSTSPIFREDIGIARSAVNGLYGAIGSDGTVIKPFEYLTISHNPGVYTALGTDFTHYIWSSDLRSEQVARHPGAVIPYDPQDDPVRAAAWHRGPVGVRLHSNNLKKVEIYTKFNSMQAACTDLRLDWGFRRFVRLEPCVVPAPTPDAMYYGSGKRFYTLKAILYEADGRFVEEVCSRGWIEATFRDGAIYNADGKERWVVIADPNAIEAPAFTMNVFDYMPVSHDDVFKGLGISIADLANLNSLYNYSDLCKKIIEGENVGISTYLPYIPDAAHAREAKMASHSHIFHKSFRMGDVVSCKVRKKEDGLHLELSKDLICHYKDKIKDPSYTMSGGSEIIFWGPNNARTVRLNLEAVPKSGKATLDDVHNTNSEYMFVLAMYEEDGSWLRNLAEAPFVDFVQDGIIVFDKLGIAVITRPLDRGPIRPMLLGEPLPHVLSAFEAALAPPAKGPHGPGQPGYPAPGQAAPGSGHPAPGQAAPGSGHPAPGQAAPGSTRPASAAPAPGASHQAPNTGRPGPNTGRQY